MKYINYTTTKMLNNYPKWMFIIIHFVQKKYCNELDLCNNDKKLIHSVIIKYKSIDAAISKMFYDAWYYKETKKEMDILKKENDRFKLIESSIPDDVYHALAALLHLEKIGPNLWKDSRNDDTYHLVEYGFIKNDPMTNQSPLS